MDVKVSIIIPVYNAESYLSECIESLLNQTLKECEFIFVNDGSSDRSREIIEKYKYRDIRINLVNQENQGVSTARNQGLKLAVGEYVGFVDADDYVERDMYETLFAATKCEDYDIVFSNFLSEMSGKKDITQYPFPNDILLNKEYIWNNILLYFMKAENFNSVCNKIFKNRLIKEHNIMFPEKVALGEDGMFNIQFFSFAQTAIYKQYVGYFYREVTGSATRDFLNHDYFQRSLETYSMAFPEIFEQIIDLKTLHRLKSIKLINSVMGQIYEATSTNASFKEKCKYINRVITNEHVKEALSIYYKEQYHILGRYERIFLRMMKSKSILGLYLITFYSQFRNKTNGGIL